MKSRITPYDKQCLLEIRDEAGNRFFRMTRVDAYKRYTRTIKPLNDLLKSLGGIYA